MLDIEKLKGTETPTEVGLKINEIIESSGSSSRNIGELVTSLLPQTDAGLHLVDGALINGDGAYADFVNYIAELYNANPTANYFTDEETWQTSVTTYGVCGKFVYDNVANTVRLPKVTGIIEGTIDLSALGDLVEAGLPNITGSGQMRCYSTVSCHGAFEDIGGNGAGNGTFNDDKYLNFNFDASRSNPIYGNSDTVQPQTIKGFVYICIATSKKTDVEVNIDNIMTDLNGKADTDLTNLTNTGKEYASGLGMPSDKYIDLTLGVSGTKYTAPANGWVVFFKNSSATQQYIHLQIENSVGYIDHSVGNSTALCLSIPVSKGQVFKVSYNAGGATSLFRFIYAQGESEE